MKRMTIPGYCFWILIIASFLSCKKYLDKKSDDALVVPTYLKDLQALLDEGTTMNSNTPAFPQASSDDYFVTEDVYNTLWYENDAYRWIDHVYSFQGDWASPYLAIYHANLCLERIGTIQKEASNTDLWNNIYGSALFFRSYYFLHLLWTYSKAHDKSTAATDLGVVLKKSTSISEPSVRSSVQDSYQQVIKDLMIANTFLLDRPLVPLRPSKAASYALLARTYLSMREYDSAYKYSNLSLGIQNELVDYNSTDVNAGNTPFQAYPFNREVIFYSIMTNSFGLKAPSFALVDSTLYSSYAPDDKRKTVFFRPNGNYQRFKGSYSAGTNSLFTGLAVNEVLLIRAECQARTGNYQNGMTDLNTLLKKRWTTDLFIPFTAASKEEALTIILRERRKELLMRGLRWADLKRLNKEGANIVPKRIIAGGTYLLPPNDNRYALPLPDDIIQLTGMQPNPR